VGSRSNLNRAYIAGFLDGDGSLMFQVKLRTDSKRGVRFMATICFYQDTRHETPLLWIKKTLKIGYISRRNDGITELRVNGYKRVKVLLIELKPFIRFKAKQVKILIKACSLLEVKPINKCSKNELKKLVDLAFQIKQENYRSRSSLTKKAVYQRLNLTP